MKADKIKRTIAADFDGTLLEYDLAEKVLTRFARGDWQHYDDLLAKEEITLEECMRSQYGMIRVHSPEEVVEYIDEYCVFRPGIKKLISECEARSVELVVVSAGLDFCIRHAFRVNDIEQPKVVCPKSSFKGSGGFGVAFPRYSFSESANYKEGFVLSQQREGRHVTFVGNGMGDLQASIRADDVFAIEGSTLDRVCTERGVAHHSVKTLTPVWRSLVPKK